MGCASAPEGSTGGRIDSYRTTDSDRNSSSASIPALLEYSDTVSQALAQEITSIPDIENAPTRCVLELGSIANKTSTPTGDFEQIRARIRGQIFQSKLIKGRFMIVEARDRMDSELNRVNGDSGQKDLLNEGTGGSAGTAKYDPKITYVLQGDFFESNRGDRRQYYFEFKLTNLATREIVFNKSFDLAQAPRGQ
jgi:hypothetical protein